MTPAPWNSPYWRQINAAIDILRAQLIGIDGFGVDLTRAGLPEPSDQARILCDAAAAVAPGFHIVPEPDGDILKQATPDQMAITIEGMAATCPTAYRLPGGRLLVVPFAPNIQPIGYWEEVLQKLAAAGQNVAFIPDLLGLAQNAKRFAPISFGMTSWGPRDPVTAQSVPLMSAERSAAALAPAWMQPVAPQDARPKAAIYWEAANTNVFRVLWHQAITGNGDYAHIITWNAYAEATQIEPSSGTQFLFYDLSAYYIEWFKTRQPPAITQDAIYYCHRAQLFWPSIMPLPDGKNFRKLGLTEVQNRIEMVALLTAPAVLEIQLAGKIYLRKYPLACRYLILRRNPAAQSSGLFAMARPLSKRKAIGKLQTD